MLLLVISPMLILNPKNTNCSLWLIGFRPRATSKMTFRAKEFSPTSLFQLSIHLKTLHQINAGNTHVVIQSSCPGVLTGENYMDVGTIFEA